MNIHRHERVEIYLRPYQTEDLEAVVTLWYRAWRRAFPDARHPQPEAQWGTRFRDAIAPHQVVWVAADEAGGDCIAGFLSMVVADGYLDQLFVDADAQGRGVGAAPMAKAKELAPRGLSLHTLQRNLCRQP